MKIARLDDGVYIYPFLSEDATEASNREGRLVVFPDGAIWLIVGQPLMNPEAARKLAEALLRAVEIAENGVK